MTACLEGVNPAEYLFNLSASSATDQTLEKIAATMWDRRMSWDCKPHSG